MLCVTAFEIMCASGGQMLRNLPSLSHDELLGTHACLLSISARHTRVGVCVYIGVYVFGSPLPTAEHEQSHDGRLSHV